MKFLNLFYFVVHFIPPGSGSGSSDRDPIRIRNTNGQLSFTCTESLVYLSCKRQYLLLCLKNVVTCCAEIGGNDFRVLWAIHSDQRPPLIAGCPEPLELMMTQSWHKVSYLLLGACIGHPSRTCSPSWCSRPGVLLLKKIPPGWLCWTQSK